MSNLRAIRIACLLLALCFIVSLCSCNAFSPQRQRRRAYTIRTDLDRMVDDVDWILGLHRPTVLYNESMR